MTDQSSSQDRPDDWSRGGYVPGEQYAGEQYYGAGAPGSSRPGHPGSGYGTPGQGGTGAARPGPGMPGQGAAGPGMPTTPIWQGAPGQDAPGLGAPPPAGSQPVGPPPVGVSPAADARGFLGALFDFSFTSFVTTRIIKVLYALIMVLAVIAALVYTVIAFRVSAAFGFVTLIIGDPLFIIIVMAFWRLVLESFVVVFRIADDIRALRERGGR